MDAPTARAARADSPSVSACDSLTLAPNGPAGSPSGLAKASRSSASDIDARQSARPMRPSTSPSPRRRAVTSFACSVSAPASPTPGAPCVFKKPCVPTRHGARRWWRRRRPDRSRCCGACDAIVALIEQRAAGVVVAEVAGRAVVRGREIYAEPPIATAPADRRRARAERSGADRDAQLGHERAAPRDQVDGAADRFGAELIGGTPRQISTRSSPLTPSADRSMIPVAARDSGMPSTRMATSFASDPRIDTDVNEPSPPRDLTNTPAVPSIRSATDVHARRRLRRIDRRHHRLRHRPAHRRAIRRWLRIGLFRARAPPRERGHHASAQLAAINERECGSRTCTSAASLRRADSWRAGRSPGSDAPLRPFPTVASRQWVASSHRSINTSLQSRGRLRHHTGFPITQARYVVGNLREE